MSGDSFGHHNREGEGECILRASSGEGQRYY